LVLDQGKVHARRDRFLPPPQALPPLRALGPAVRPDAPPTATAARRRTVGSELRRLYRAGRLDADTTRSALQLWQRSKASVRALSGTRQSELRSVVDMMQWLASTGRLTAGRVPVVFEILRRNREWWNTGSLLAYGQRVEFDGSELVWQEYPGHGIQPQWLGTFGKANWLCRAKKSSRLESLLDEVVGLASPRAGGIAWESYFAFSGSPPLWVSGLSQGTGIQALSCGSVLLDRPDLLDAARRALGVFQRRAPVGVRVPGKAGPHYLIYSGAPNEYVLNAFIQSLNGLFDYAQTSGDPVGQRLFDEGEKEAEREVPYYDTGAWSLYDGVHESDLGYHELLQEFLGKLCDRTDVPVFCDTAQRFKDDLTTPPALKLLTTRARVRRPVAVRFQVSKISTVALKVDGTTVASARVTRGTHTFTWGGRKRRGDVAIQLVGTDLAGNTGTQDGTIRLVGGRRHKARE
jgi:hypothetical protein